MTHLQAVETVNELMESLKAGGHVLVRHGLPPEYLRAFQATGDLQSMPKELVNYMHHQPWNVQREIAVLLSDLTARRLWSEHRIIYDIDPVLWRELGETQDDDIIPLDVLQHLPHPNPYLHFPKPLMLHGDETQQVVGVFVTGRRMLQARADEYVEQMISTASPECLFPSLQFAGVMMDETGKPKRVKGIGSWDVTHTRTSLNPSAGSTLTFKELVDIAAKRFHQQDPVILKDLETMLRSSLSVLVYICAANADLKALPKGGTKPKKGSKGAGSGPKKPNVITVGYRLGSKIRAWKQSEQTRAAKTPTGRTVAPHVRRAHFHTFRVGKGRTETRVRWLYPIPVGFKDAATLPTVVPVKKIR